MLSRCLTFLFRSRGVFWPGKPYPASAEHNFRLILAYSLPRLFKKMIQVSLADSAHIFGDVLQQVDNRNISSNIERFT